MMAKLYHRTMMVSLPGRVRPLEASCNGRFLSADLIMLIMMVIMVIMMLIMVIMVIMVIMMLIAYIAN